MRGAVLAVLSLALALAGGELFARLAAPRTVLEAQRQAHQDYLELEPSTPFFRRQGGVWVANRSRSTAGSFPISRPKGEKLWFVAGESVAQRVPADRLSWALAARAVNAGLGGYGSSAVLATVTSLLAQSPDGLIVLVGNNGVGPAVGGLTARLARRSRMARLWLDWRNARRETDAQWESDVRRLVRAARGRGVRVVLCTLPVNAAAAPYGSLQLEREDPDFDAGWTAYEAGRAGEAAAAFARAAERHPSHALAWFWLAQAKRSRADLERAVELDYPDRCKPSRNALIRRIAAEEGASLADLDEAFRKLGAGRNAFLDEVHWRARWNPVAVAYIAAAATGQPADARAPTPAPLSLKDARDLTRRALAYAIQAGENSSPALDERLLQELERVWRERPGLAARMLDDRRAAGKLLAESDWTSPFASPSDRGWASARRHLSEARRRARRPPDPF